MAPCPRCPKGSQHAANHGSAHNGLIQCQTVDCTTAQYDFNDFWPEIMFTREDMNKNERGMYDALMGAVDGKEYDVVRDMYAALKRGEKEFQGARFTKTLAERIVSCMEEFEREKEEKGKGAAQAQAVSASSQVAGRSAGQRAVAAATQGVARLGLNPGASAFSPRSAFTLPPTTATTPTTHVSNPTTSGQATQSQRPSSAGQPDASASSVNVASPAASPVPPAAKIALPPAPLNPVAPGLKAGNSQATDQRSVLQYVDTVASSLLADERGRQYGGNQSVQQLQLNATQQELQRIKDKFALRTGFAKADPKWTVQTNHLVMGFPSRIHVYTIEMIRAHDPVHWKILVKKREDKLLALNVIVTLPHFNDLQTHRASWVSDGDLIWSTVPLIAAANAQPPTLTLTGNPAVQYPNEMGTMLGLEEVKITSSRTIDLTRPVGELFYDTTAGSYDESLPGVLTRGLNAFFTRYVHNNPAMFTFSGRQNKAYFNHASFTLDGPNQQTLRAMKGYFLSVRPGVESMYLNINTATSPFYQNLLVSEVISRMTAPKNTGGQGRPLSEVEGALKGVKVRIDYPVNQGGFPTAASRVRFINNFGQHEVQVQDWYNPRGPWTRLAEFPNPAWVPPSTDTAVNVGKDEIKFPGQQKWYPASSLRIVEWHPHRGRLTSDQTSAMIRVALMNPNDHRARILSNAIQQDQSLGGLRHFGFAGPAANGQSQAGLQALNMRAGTQFLEIPGRMLQAPGVYYRGHKAARVGIASWNLNGIRFLNTTLITEMPVLIMTDGRRQILGQQHCRHVASALHRHGLTQAPLPQTVTPIYPQPPTVFNAAYNPSPQFEYSIVTQLEEIVKKHRGVPILVVIRDKDADIYSAIKRAAELRVGAKTVCVTFSALDRKKGRGPPATLPFDDQTASNIALKFNLKSPQGANHAINQVDLSRLRNKDNRCNTIVLGADVAHPTKTAHTATPSIAAVVGSTDDGFIHFPGSMRLQRSKKEDIIDIADMVKERLIDWAQRHNNTLPTNMLFYRDGVSESQYDIIRRREIPQLQIAMNMAHRYLISNSTAPSPPAPPAPPKAQGSGKGRSKVSDSDVKSMEEDFADAIENDRNNIPFNLTFVVVGKRHHTRFYAMNPTQHTSSGRNTNVHPGLAVDQVITHPFGTDFYLQSHQAIQGTGRAAHYFVLRNNMHLSIEQLQNITHTFCYAYAKATKGVSYCAPAYYADRLCDRGRAYFRHWLMGRPGVATQGPIQPGQTALQYADFVKDFAQDSRYWRWYLNQGYTAQQAPPRKYGQLRKNPWHENLDDTMFYL